MARKTDTLCFLVTVAILTGLGGSALYLSNALYVRSNGYALIVLRRPATDGFLVALPIAMLTALLFHVRGIGPGPRVRKPPPPWIKRGIAALIALGSVGAVAWARGYVQFTGSAIVEQETFAWSRTVRPYSDISELILAHYWIYRSRGRGYPSRGRAVFVVFKDGTRWSLGNIGLQRDAAVNLQVVRHLAAQTRLLIEYREEAVGVPRKPRSPVPALVAVALLAAALFAAGMILRKRARRLRRKRPSAGS
jgi:hypothetical protein